MTKFDEILKTLTFYAKCETYNTKTKYKNCDETLKTSTSYAN